MVRNLKAQIQRDARRVFLSLGDFGTLEKIRYWRDGGNSPPVELEIPCVIDSDNTDEGNWNKNNQRQRVGSTTMYQKDDQQLYRRSTVLFCAKEDFSPYPRKDRRLSVGNRMYRVSSVGEEGGLLLIGLTEYQE